nr:hypothetical protein [Tanacetum cinerariifolium]
MAQNQQGYNAWQDGGVQVTQNTGQNLGVQNGANQNGTSNIVAARLRVLEMGIKSGATIVKDWVTLLGIAHQDQGEWM